MADNIQIVIEDELDTWGRELYDALVEKLHEKKAEHSGQTYAMMGEENFNIILSFGKGEASWVVNMKDYWKYVEYGTKGGGWMPKEKFKDWFALKAINPSTVLHDIRIKSLQKQGKSIQGLKPLPYAVAVPRLAYIFQRSIYKKGVSEYQKRLNGKKSTNFISETLEPQVQILAQRLSKKLARPILAIVKEEIEKK